MRRLPNCVDAAAFVSLTALAACVHTPPPLSPPPPQNLHSPFTGFSSAHYGAPSAWLCLPGQPNNPCDADLDSTEIRPDGSFASDPAPPPASQRADCFYVYPTVDMSLSADNHTDFTDTKRIAYIALRADRTFSARAPAISWCRSIGRRPSERTIVRRRRVNATWLSPHRTSRTRSSHYMGQLNGGRKIVLIGHFPQGAEMVAQLTAPVASTTIRPCASVSFWRSPSAETAIRN